MQRRAPQGPEAAAACAARLQSDAFAEATLYDGARQFYPAKVAAALLRASGATLYAPCPAFYPKGRASRGAGGPYIRCAW